MISRTVWPWSALMTAVLPEFTTMAPGQLIDKPEPGIVPRPLVALAGIAKTHDDPDRFVFAHFESGKGPPRRRPRCSQTAEGG